MKKQKVGILGTGDVGKALARGFAGRGCEVRIGSRERKGDFVTFAEAAQFGDLVLLATKWSGTEHALELAGPANFAGKVVIDATNPLKEVDGRPQGLDCGFNDSGGERIQRWLPAARVVKAFNTVGNALMIDPKLPGGPPTMFIAGDDDAAKGTVTALLEETGWDVADLGGIAASRYLEPMCLAWTAYGFRTGSWQHAFKLLHP
jgi:predicted dinucleotide-binding enzyme